MPKGYTSNTARETPNDSKHRREIAAAKKAAKQGGPKLNAAVNRAVARNQKFEDAKLKRAMEAETRAMDKKAAQNYQRTLKKK